MNKCKMVWVRIGRDWHPGYVHSRNPRTGIPLVRVIGGVYHVAGPNIRPRRPNEGPPQ